VRKFCCSGTLIADNLVLTAYHCSRPQTPDFVLFCNDVNDTAAREVAVNHVYVCSNNIDLLLLVLAERQTGVSPARIATSQIPSGFPTDQPSLDFGVLEVVGFGATNVQGSAGTYSKKRYANVGIAGDDPTRLGYTEGLEFAAGKVNSDTDTCSGDSGGPGYLHLTQSNETILLGCTSRGTPAPANATPDKVCGDGGIYVRVDKQLQWIKQIAASVNTTLP
jgi:secreted trypsin-like serine protease